MSRTTITRGANNTPAKVKRSESHTGFSGRSCGRMIQGSKSNKNQRGGKS